MFCFGMDWMENDDDDSLLFLLLVLLSHTSLCLPAFLLTHFYPLNRVKRDQNNRPKSFIVSLHRKRKVQKQKSFFFLASQPPSMVYDAGLYYIVVDWLLMLF